MTLRICKKCNKEKELSLFVKKKNKHVYYLYTCLDCNKIYNSNYHKSYYEENKEHLVEISSIWYKENIDKKKLYDKEYGLLHKEDKKEYDAIYSVVNKEKINNRFSKYRKKRYHKDPVYKLRRGISRDVNAFLKRNGSSKNNKSIVNYLPYSIEELKIHLETLFEPWMSWLNHGRYIKKNWADNDQSTWTWNIDHIIPQSKLLYASMEDDNFKKCWSLDNLRPYSSKQNIIDSNRE